MKQGPMSNAKREIEKLKREVARLTKLVEPVVAEDGSNVALLDYVDGNRNLPKGSKIGFRIGGDIVSVRHDGDALEVYWSGGIGRLVVLPDVSNVFHVAIWDRKGKGR